MSADGAALDVMVGPTGCGLVEVMVVGVDGECYYWCCGCAARTAGIVLLGVGEDQMSKLRICIS